MTTKRDNSLQFVSVRLNGKNYSYWSYVMKNFLRVKNCGDILLECNDPYQRIQVFKTFDQV